MGLNYARMQRIVDRQIKSFGGGTNNAALRRAGSDRSCSVVILSFSERDFAGGLIERTDKRVLISALNLTPDPDFQLDSLILGGVEHKMVFAPTPLAPDGTTVLYWEVVARL
jgi:hypothetical protein